MAQIILDSNNNLIQGDFDNATLNNRTKLQTTTTNATTNVYVVPNGSSTSAGVSVANNSSLTNASKIVMATNGTTDTQIISGVNGSGSYLPLSFYTNNALAGQFTTAGLLSLPGGGITFPATQVPSADANTLDDYEEGTFTPNITLGGGATGITYGQRVGYYVKVGRVVHVNCYVLLTNKGSSTGAISFTGFPFTANNAADAYNTFSFYCGSATSTSGSYMCYISPNTTAASLLFSQTGSAASFGSTQTNNASDFIISGTYMATA